MKKIEQLTNGHIIIGKLGRLEEGPEPNWIHNGEIELFVQKHNNEIILIVPNNIDWAEYTKENFHEDSNSFENEGYCMKIIDWNL